MSNIQSRGNDNARLTLDLGLWTLDVSRFAIRKRNALPMKLGLINSAWVQANQPTVYGLRKTKELGFDCVDIFVDPLDIDVTERRLIKDECDRLALPIMSIACVAVGLVDFNPSVQRFHIER